MSDLSYEEVIDYISSIPRFTKKTELANTEKILARLGNLHNGPKSVHIAGTNGKGSVAKMLSMFLTKKGFKTGLFISPHLVKVNERISIDDENISDDEMVHIFSIIKNTIDDMLESSEPECDIVHPAYFEFLFLIAATYFADKNCDYVVYETGLGGRLDATNVLSPELCVITSIGMDHMQYLGNTIEEIAWEKAGIIKTNVPVIFNTGNELADSVILKRAAELCSPAINVVEYKLDNREYISQDVLNIIDSFDALYQKDNAATVIEALSILGFSEESGYSEILEQVFGEFYWPGRMEFLADNIVIDGAHNEDAIIRCVESVKSICKKRGFKKVSILFAVSSDKDYESIIRILSKQLNNDEICVEDVYVSELDSDRGEDVGVVMKLFQKYLPDKKHFDVVGNRSIERSWDIARGELDEDTLLLVVGSLYMVGEIKKYVGN